MATPTPAPKPTPTPAPPPAPAATPTPAPSTSANGRKFTVKYRSAANVYLDAGRAAGVGEGDRLRVISGQATVAELEVAYVAELSASCTIVSETRPVRAGAVPLKGTWTQLIFSFMPITCMITCRGDPAPMLE